MKDRLIACLLVCMIVLSACSPAFAAGTTDSQIMMVPSDDGFAPLSIDSPSGSLRYRLEILSYDPFTFEWNYIAASDFVDVNSIVEINDFSFVYDDSLDYYYAVRFYEFASDGSGRVTSQGKNYNIRFGRLNLGIFSDFEELWANPEAGKDSFAFFSSLYETDMFIKYPVSSYSFYRDPTGGFGFYQSFNSPVTAFYYTAVFGTFKDVFASFSFVDGQTYRFTYSTHGTVPPMLSSNSSGSGGSDGALDSAINQTTSAVQQVNSSIQSMSAAISSEISALSSQMGQMTQAIQQSMQQMVQQLEQQTNTLSQLITNQIQSIRQDLGLVNDNLSSGFSSVTTSITNQTTQITGKIDTLQQSVVNKLDTVNQSVTEGFDSTVQELETANKTLDEMPDKIGNKLLELFVPSAEDMEAYYDKFSTLMESKLGFVWQVIDDILIGLFTTLINGFTNPQTTITIPALALPGLGQIWQEMSFNIIPEGMEFITDYTKLLTNLVFLLLVINRIVDFRNTFFEYYNVAAPVGEQIAAEYWAEQDARTATRTYNQRRASFAKARGRR